MSSHVLESIRADAPADTTEDGLEDREPRSTGKRVADTATMRAGPPDLEQVLQRAQRCGIPPERYQRYADRRWGVGWKLSPHGRRRVWDELERYVNDPQGYLDKVESELRSPTRKGTT